MVASRTRGVSVPVAYHVFESGSSSKWSRILRTQTAYLNKAFGGKLSSKAPDTNIRFVTAKVSVHDDARIRTTCSFSNVERAMKTSFGLDPSKYVNVYVCANKARLGLARLPQTLSKGEHDALNGIILDKSVLPGSPGKFSRGGILVHEMGHHFGLKHPYDGGCSGTNDGISDTPAMRGSPSSCKPRNSCPNDAGVDPVHNFMLATPDRCRTEFTSGQVREMWAVLEKYRPALLKRKA